MGPITRRSRRSIAGAAVAVLILGACGASGADPDGASQSTTKESDPTSDAGAADGQRDPQLDDLLLCTAAGQVSATLSNDQGSENMTGEDYVTWVDQMNAALEDLLAADPPADIKAAAEELSAGFQELEEALDSAPRGPDIDHPADSAAVDALISAFPDESAYFALGDIVSGNELNCS